MSCPVCRKDDSITLNTFKHYWIFCRNCQCAERKSKQDVGGSDSESFYNYFVETEHIKRSIRAAHRDIAFLTAQGLKIEESDILDIGGGSGTYINEFRKLGANVAMVEYNENAVEYAQNEYGLEASKFDFQADQINTLFNKTFNLVIINRTITFAKDIHRFLKELESIVSRDTYIFFEYINLASVEQMLWAQNDDYTHNILYAQKSFLELMRSYGYDLVYAEDNKRAVAKSLKRKVADFVFGLPLRLKLRDFSFSLNTPLFLFKKV